MNLPIVTIYTDGSCRDGMGGWAAVLRYYNQQLNICGSDINTTNNRMEISAVINALSRLNTKCEVHLYSDSKYVLDGLNWCHNWSKNNWRTTTGPVVNLDLWQVLFQLASEHKIHKHWVKGHNGDEYNEACDTLAKYARDFQIK